MSAPRFVFRRSARLFAVRLAMLMVVTFGGLTVLMYPDWPAALAISALAALVASLWYYFSKHRATSIVVDDEAIVGKSRSDEVRIRWVDVTELAIGETILPLRNGNVPVRFCLLRGLGSRRLAFADLTYVDNRQIWVGASGTTPILDVADSDVLLGLVADKLEDERFLPEEPAAEPDEEEPAAGDDAPAEVEEKDPAERRRLRPGLLALFVKLGANLVKPVVGLFKGTQGILALASMGALALLFSWQGAVAIMVMLLFHEYGHVHAMRRSGIPVKGIYFIPVIGAAAVAEDVWKTRGEQAYIALNGPLWGAALTLVPLGVVVATGDRYPLAGAVAIAWAFINLLNLLPITPLDGGRVLSAVGYSIHSRLGLILSFTTLIVGVGLALWAGLYLFVLLLPIGLLELSGERSATARVGRLAHAASLADAAPEELAKLKVWTRPGFPDPSEEKLRQVEVARIRRLHKLARIEPMTPRKAALWFGAYLALAVALAAMMLWVASVFPELRSVLSVLR